jgi:hypothetical protein
MSITSSLKGLKDTAGIDQPFNLDSPNMSFGEEETNMIDWDKSADLAIDNTDGTF